MNLHQGRPSGSATDSGGLDALLNPRGVAIIGASDDPSRIGGRPVDYYKRSGFAGGIYPVNPKRETVQGLKAYASIAEIDGPVDFATLALPADRIEAAMEEVAAKGIKAVLVFSAGFAEVGDEGRRLQDRVVAFARRHGIRMLGPNCLGLYNAAIGHTPTFSSALQDRMPRAGRIGMITQSGAYGTHILNIAHERHLDVGTWISTGNEADISVAECLEYMIDNDTIDAAALYMEAVHDTPTFFRALEKARRAGKPVAIMKVGTSEVGAKAAQSHTASLAGSDASFDAALRRYGALRATTTEELLDIVYVASRCPLPKGRKLGILTISGGAGVLMADSAARHGLHVPPMPEAAQAKALERNPFSSPVNPIDVTAHAMNDFDLVSENLASMVEDGGYDMMALFFSAWVGSDTLAPRILNAIRSGLRGQEPRPTVLLSQGTAQQHQPFEEEGLVIFEEPDRAIAALSHLARFAEAMAEDGEETHLPEIDCGPLPGTALGEVEAKRFFARAGIPVLQERSAATADDAGEIAAELGFPVVLKIDSPNIAHKSEVGGVALSLNDEHTVRSAAEAMRRKVGEQRPDASIDGFIVAPMAGDGIELLLGVRTDPVMGPMAVVGLGGIFVEVLKDVAIELAPVGPKRARAMIERLKGAAILKGARGKPPVDIDAAADVLSRLSVIGAANPGRFDSLEINPLLVREEGAVALDALVTVSAGTDGEPDG